jgi:hypothetical protein
MYQINKPSNWSRLPLYKKIKYYGSQLNELYSPYVDKIEAKNIVKATCGDDIHVARIIRILDSPSDICASDMNPLHLIKSAHGSAWNIDPSNTNIETAKQLLTRWNTLYNNGRERQYIGVPRRFFIEEKIDDHEFGITGLANTYTIRCIYGKPVTFHIKRNGKFNAWIISSWRQVMSDAGSIQPPPEAGKMIELAEKLSQPFEFVRIDFYLDAQRRIFFSEYTFTPNAGTQFYSTDVEYELGALWTS